MTEKQIQQLKSMLKESSYADNSPELDDEILAAARARTPKVERSFNWRSFLPINFVLTTALAIVLTVTLFFGMSHMISIDEPIQLSEKTEPTFNDQRTAGELAAMGDNFNINRPENIAASQAPTYLSRDEILMDFDLPSPSVLVAKMDFEFPNQRASAQKNISLAMNDIRSLIEIGELDNARERYAKLKETCGVCTLPDTLEALVLDNRLLGNLYTSSSTG